MPSRPNSPLCDDPLHLPDVGIESVGMADDQLQAGTLRRGDHRVAVGQRKRQRLLDEDVLAVLQRLDCLTRMEAVRGGDVDRLDRRVPAQVARSRHRRSPKSVAKVSRGRGSGSMPAHSAMRGCTAAARIMNAPARPRPAMPSRSGASAIAGRRIGQRGPRAEPVRGGC